MAELRARVGRPQTNGSPELFHCWPSQDGASFCFLEVVLLSICLWSACIVGSRIAAILLFVVLYNNKKYIK